MPPALMAAFEAFPGAAPTPRAKAGGKLRPALSRSAFQPVERDFAFVVAEDVDANSVLRAVRGADKALIADAAVFDVYRGKGIAEGSKSLAVAVTLQPHDATPHRRRPRSRLHPHRRRRCQGDGGRAAGLMNGACGRLLLRHSVEANDILLLVARLRFTPAAAPTPIVGPAMTRLDQGGR